MCFTQGAILHMLRKAKETSYRRRIESEASAATRNDLAVTATFDSDRAINPIKHVDRRLAHLEGPRSLCASNVYLQLSSGNPWRASDSRRLL